jgi:hypothetical protein
MKEWYLIGNKTKPNMLGGYENQSFLDYKEDAFAESLETDIASTVLLFNHDLSQSKELRGVIQGNVADSSLKSMERCILVPIGTLHSGNYIFFEDEYWLIDGRPGNNGEYEKAVLKECQYKIKWQKDDGTIIERWANFTSASKYDIGESGNSTIILSSNNFTILIPHDADGLTIDGKRIFVDTSEIPKKVFKITRNDDVLFLHGNHGGTLSLIADKTEFNPNKDNQELRICDYIDPSSPLPPTPPEPDETTDLRCVISGNTNLKNGYRRSYTVTFSDKDGNVIDWQNINFIWNIVNNSGLITNAYENKIDIFLDNEDLIGSSFLLQVIVAGEVLAESKIIIIE